MNLGASDRIKAKWSKASEMVQVHFWCIVEGTVGRKENSREKLIMHRSKISAPTETVCKVVKWHQ